MQPQGYVLQPNDVESIINAAQELSDAQIYADQNFAPDQNLNTLVRAVRLLQVSLELQMNENADLADDFNAMQTEFAVRWSMPAGLMRARTHGFLQSATPV